jgi:hypothetical protein
MAFPRRIKDDTWFMRLPTGEVEIVTASALEDAFHCGLADARTPVRSVACPVWTSLAEVAEIDTSDPSSLGSLLPVALEEPAADLARGKAWSVRTDLDASAFTSGRRGVIGAGLAIAGLLALMVFGGSQLPDPAPSTAAGGAAAEMTAHARAPRAPTNAIELCWETKEEREPPITRAALEARLHEMDALRVASEAAHRHHGRRAKRSRTSLEAPRGYHAPAGPFTNGGDPRDPLNGAL